LRVENRGPDNATNVLVTIALPNVVTFDSAVPGAGACVFNVTVQCKLGQIDSGAAVLITLTVATTVRAKFSLTASVSADQTDTDPTNDEAGENTEASLSNLVVQQLLTPKGAAPNSSITINDVTANLGSIPAGASATRFYLSLDRNQEPGEELGSGRAIGPLAFKESSAGSTQVNIPAGTAFGRYFLIAVADADNAVIETAEKNKNVKPLLITLPDLVVAGLRAPASAAAGAVVSVEDTTSNKSLAATGNQPTTRFFLSLDQVWDAGDTPLQSRLVPALAGKEKHSGSTNVTIPANTAPGTYYLIGKADNAEIIMETDENNNSRARRITITP
jgi:subtilase family serine protease